MYVDPDYKKNFIEFPDEYGNIKLYIATTYSYDTIKKYNISTIHRCSHNKCISYICTTESECLYNKCIDNICVYNDKSSVVHCDNIYNFSPIFGSSSYMYCGKSYDDICKSNKECSSKECLEGFCTIQTDGPYDNQSITIGLTNTILWM
eukprot:jgi/Orpsp1_1/1175015/evm.model.c7180000052317.1